MVDLTTFRRRYPAFIAVPDGTVTYWLNDADRFVDESWPIEADRDPAKCAVAAHHLIGAGSSGAGDADIAALLAAGVTDFKSDRFSVSFAAEVIATVAAGGFASTKPGQEYLALLSRNKGGVRVTAPGTACLCDGFNGFAGPMPYPARLFGC
ncbi:DUF4054 domain-containing protein [Sphingomonas sp.]|uniref:DUF4054 domain-containing protein n=1 Tax=Sphingomonas sp. TaxID=28214 RepID=UPI0035C7D2ED